MRRESCSGSCKQLWAGREMEVLRVEDKAAPTDWVGRDSSPTEWQAQGQLRSISGCSREARVEDSGRNGGGRAEGQEGWGRAPTKRQRPTHVNSPLGLGSPDQELIPRAGSVGLAIWLSYRT